MIWRDIKGAFWDVMGGEAAVSPQLNDEVLATYANMAVRELVDETKCLQKVVSVEVGAGEQEYDLPDDVERIWRVAYDWQKIHPVSKWELQRADPFWDRTEGLPRRYYLNGINGKIGLWHIPSVDTLMDGGVVAALGLTLFYDYRPTDIASDTDEPLLPSWAHPLVLFYMLRAAYSMIGVQRSADQAAYWGRRYEEGKTRLKARTSKKSPVRYVIRESRGLRDGWDMPRYPEFIPDPEA